MLMKDFANWVWMYKEVYDFSDPFYSIGRPAFGFRKLEVDGFGERLLRFVEAIPSILEIDRKGNWLGDRRIRRQCLCYLPASELPTFLGYLG